MGTTIWSLHYDSCLLMQAEWLRSSQKLESFGLSVVPAVVDPWPLRMSMSITLIPTPAGVNYDGLPSYSPQFSVLNSMLDAESKTFNSKLHCLRYRDEVRTLTFTGLHGRFLSIAIEA
ncbi:hypothetical protein VNO77_22908 [Canavalia gladiata]|uniref:Uncharacterized protein n=1 Tax=Canavalia gladiata TaxID=3824 RepID=A0AAN9L4E1_CANGL